MFPSDDLSETTRLKPHLLVSTLHGPGHCGRVPGAHCGAYPGGRRPVQQLVGVLALQLGRTNMPPWNRHWENSPLGATAGACWAPDVTAGAAARRQKRISWKLAVAAPTRSLRGQRDRGLGEPLLWPDIHSTSTLLLCSQYNVEQPGGPLAPITGISATFLLSISNTE